MWGWIYDKLFNNSGKICVVTGVIAAGAVVAPVVGVISVTAAAGVAIFTGATSLMSGMKYARKMERQELEKNKPKDIETPVVTKAKDDAVTAEIETLASLQAQVKALNDLALVVSGEHQQAIDAKKTELDNEKKAKLAIVQELADEKAAKELKIQELADEKAKFEKFAKEKAENELKAQKALDEKSEELKVANQKLAVKEGEFIDALKKLDEKEKIQSQLQEKVDTQSKVISSLNDQLSKLNVIHGGNDTALMNARSEIRQLNLEVNLKVGELEDAKKQLSAATQVNADAQQEIKKKIKELASVEAEKECKVKELAEEKAAHELNAQQAQKLMAKLKEKDEEYSQLQVHLANQLNELDAVKEQLRLEKLNSSTAQGVNLEAIAAAKAKILKLDRALETKTQEVENTKESLAKAKSVLIQVQQNLEVKTKEHESATLKIKESNNTQLSLKAQLEELQRDLATNGNIIKELTAANDKATSELQALKEVKPAQVPAKPAQVIPAQSPVKLAEVKPAQMPAKPIEVKPAQAPVKPSEAKPASPVAKSPLKTGESTEAKTPAAVTKRSDSFFGKPAAQDKTPSKQTTQLSRGSESSPALKGSAEKPKVLIEKFNKLTAEGKKLEAKSLKEAYQCYEDAWKLEVPTETAETYSYMHHKGKTALLIRMLFISLKRLDEFSDNGKIRKGIDSRELAFVINHAKQDLQTLVNCMDLEVEVLDIVDGVINLQIILAILCNDNEGQILIYRLYRRFKQAGFGDFEAFFQFEKIHDVIQAMKAAARGGQIVQQPPVEQSLPQEPICSNVVTEPAPCSPIIPRPPTPPMQTQSNGACQTVPAPAEESEGDNVFARGLAKLKKAPVAIVPPKPVESDIVSVFSSAMDAIIARRAAVAGDNESGSESDNEFDDAPRNNKY